MGGAILAVFIIPEAGPDGAVEPIRQFVRGFELIIPNGTAALTVAAPVLGLTVGDIL